MPVALRWLQVWDVAGVVAGGCVAVASAYYIEYSLLYTHTRHTCELCTQSVTDRDGGRAHSNLVEPSSDGSLASLGGVRFAAWYCT